MLNVLTSNLFINTRLYTVLIVLIVVSNPVLSLYEDQIGKFDWKQSYIGKLKFAEFDTSSSVKKIFVATEENVLAALNIKSGQILWRQILEKGDTGKIHFLGVDGESLVTVSGHKILTVRGWDSSSSLLLFEWTIPSQTSSSLAYDKWFVDSGNLFHLQIIPKSHFLVTGYGLEAGTKTGETKIKAIWLVEDSKCSLTLPYLTCLDLQGKALWSANIQEQSDILFQETPLSSIGELLSLEEVAGSQTLLVARRPDNSGVLLSVGSAGATLLNYKVPKSGILLYTKNEDSDIILHIHRIKEGVAITGSDLETGTELTDLSATVKYPVSLGKPLSGVVACMSRKDKGLGCRVLLGTEDHAIVMLHHPGKIIWVREESLTSIVAVEMLDLPVSDTDAALENEFDQKESGMLGMFIHRLASQALQFRSILLTVLGFGAPPSADQRAGLVRDEFSLHKMIVAATAAGKVFGIDNLSGEIIWQQYLEDVSTYSCETQQMVLFVQRTTRHFPYPAQCALLAKHKHTSEGILFTFNPFSGQSMGNGVEQLSIHVKQALLLHQTDEQFLRGLVLLDDKNRLHVYPSSAISVVAQVAHSTFIFTADPTSGILTGFSLRYSTPKALIATPIWEVKLGDNSQKITTIVGKSPLERVHSQGRVLGDRSVLYKYVNPNLVAIATQGFDPIHKHLLNVYLLDVVSGAILFSVTHKRAKEPFYLVHSENWVLYSYFSDKSRRTEVVTLELYEGKVQSNTTAFSSLSAPIQPLVDRQAYILPASIEALKETITEKGITSKHILVALSTGGVLELPWMFVDPRRPITVTPEMREEGVIPYMPELPVPADSIINYNQTVHRVKGIHTAASGLESTCLVLVYGLDLFYTRVAPSKTFDVLKEDFDHLLIAAVLLGLAIASYITRKLASRKALKQAWK